MASRLTLRGCVMPQQHLRAHPKHLHHPRQRMHRRLCVRSLVVGYHALRDARLAGEFHPCLASGLAHLRTFSRNLRAQVKQLIEAVNQLMTPPDPPKRPIGFVTSDEFTHDPFSRNTRNQLKRVFDALRELMTR